MNPLALDAPDLLPFLEIRADPERTGEQIAARDLARYYGLLARELAGLSFTRAEAELLYHAVTGATRAREDGEPFASLAAAVLAEWRRTCGMDHRQPAHGDALAERVAGFTAAQTLAVLDACERFGALARREGWTEIPDMLRAVGLLRAGC